jgi:predicted HD phosphohydrolase
MCNAMHSYFQNFDKYSLHQNTFQTNIVTFNETNILNYVNRFTHADLQADSYNTKEWFAG